MIITQILKTREQNGNIAILEDFDRIFISLTIVDRLGNIRENDVMLSCYGYLEELK